MTSRWYLTRLDYEPGLPIALVVEELAPTRRGLMSVIQSRRHGREILPLLRCKLEERIAEGENLRNMGAPAPRAFDPVEDDVEP
jgi:hypothetical protein